MKNLGRFLTTYIILICAIPVIASTVQHKVVFDTNIVIDTTVAQDGNSYSVIKFPDCSLLSEEGAPQLPVKMINLIIPAGEEVDKVVISKGSSSVISLNYPVLPGQKPVPTSDRFEGNEFVPASKEIYSLDKPYPTEPGRVVRTNYTRGNKVVVVEVSPVFYNPVKNQLDIYESMEISLQLKPSEKVLRSAPVRNKEKFDTYLKALVDNKDDVEKYSVIKEKQNSEEITKSVEMTTGISIYCEYVVITTSALSSYFDDFIEWKKQKGIDIELVTVEQIMSNYTGDNISCINDNAGKIRQFLYDAYANGLEYALLGGTSSVVPIRYGAGLNNTWDYLIADDSKIPTDLYFADFDGDWDVDNDQYYGESYGDNVNYGAEIFVGRLLCTSGTQIQDWTNKLLLYEKDPGNGSTSYLRKAFYTQADEMQDDDQATDIATRFGNIFTADEIFEEEYNGTPDAYSVSSPQFPTGASVIDEMNSDYGFISWFNHGAPENIAVGTKRYNECGSSDKKKVTNYDSNTTTFCLYSESDNGLDDLSNTTKPFVLYTLACETMPFDTWAGISPTSNLGAMITNSSNKGGPEYIGNTRYGFVTPSWNLQRAFTSQITGGTYHLGIAEANSKGSSGSHFVWLSHNLLGCPETEIWTDTPSQFTNAYATICGDDVIVNTGGITYCTVCVMSSNDGGASYWDVDESSPAEKTFYNVSEPFVITITKHNYIPKIIQSSEIDMSLSSTVSGSTNLCSSGAYEIEEIPVGSTITWSQSNNITRTSAQGANPCTFSANGSGEGWIEATVNNGCTNITLTRKYVYVGQLPAPTISGPTTLHCGTGIPYSVDELSEDYGTSFYWASYVVNIANPTSPTCTATGYENGSGYISCTLTTCGVPKTTYKNINVICLGLLISPNPVTNETTVSIVTDDNVMPFDEDAEWSIEIYSEAQTVQVKKTKLKANNVKLQTGNWKEGVYVVRVKYKDKILIDKLVVKK